MNDRKLQVGNFHGRKLLENYIPRLENCITGKLNERKWTERKLNDKIICMNENSMTSKNCMKENFMNVNSMKSKNFMKENFMNEFHERYKVEKTINETSIEKPNY